MSKRYPIHGGSLRGPPILLRWAKENSGLETKAAILN
jgi:hypothetical protein